MLIGTGWLRYLWRSRRNKILLQFIRMAKFHRTRFETLLENIFQVTEQYHARFTFPIVASTALRNQALISEIFRSPHEIASHGFKHVNYRYLSERQQAMDIKRSILAFKSMNVPIHGFRAPYNAYTEHTPRLLERHHFLWDGGIGHNPIYWERRHLFRIRVDKRESEFICVPLCKWSDDGMIDTYGLKNWQMAKILRNAARMAAKDHGAIMFDLHPIRIGQPKYIDVLRQVLDYGTKLDGWFPTVTDAVNYWRRHGKWKDGASFCCLLTGDIDNFTFMDYSLRLL